MANLLARIKGAAGEPERMTPDEYAEQLNSFLFDGIGYGYGYSYGYGGLTPGVQQTLGGGKATEMAPNHFVGLAAHAYASNGVVFACMLVRQLLFSTIRFQWQRLRGGKPSSTFATPDLQVLETPWPGGTTQDLLSRMLQDADLAGNTYWTLQTSLALLGTTNPTREFVRLRPDWTGMVVADRMMPDGRGQIGWSLAGYLYAEYGWQSSDSPVALFPDEVVHFAPIPDPLACYRGMSWLTPILREIQADQAMTRHQRKFFDNGATPNMIIKHMPGATQDKVQKWLDDFKDKHTGVENAYKTLQLYPGADATVVGTNLKDIDFDNVRSGGEVRIAAAAGVPPVIVGLAKGLDSATYSNYGQARRRLADGTAHPLWQNLAGSLQRVMNPPGSDVRLWYDTHDVPFLREDEADAADIAATKAATINSYISAGYEPDSVIAAVEANDLSLLVHSGLYSVQLQQPGSQTPDLKPTLVSTNGGSTNGATAT
jgi:phage portal protein BeeE